MRARTACFSMVIGALVSVLAACGNGGGSGGGGGGGGGTTSASTGSQSTTSTTSGGGAPGCMEMCTRLNMCPGTTPSDCATDCPNVDSANTDGNCTGKYDVFVKCVLSDPDPCSAANNACAPDATDYVSCYSDFCMQNPMHAGCM